jgi:hypothetical protein
MIYRGNKSRHVYSSVRPIQTNRKNKSLTHSQPQTTSLHQTTVPRTSLMQTWRSPAVICSFVLKAIQLPALVSRHVLDHVTRWLSMFVSHSCWDSVCLATTLYVLAFTTKLELAQISAPNFLETHFNLHSHLRPVSHVFSFLAYTETTNLSLCLIT